MTSVMTTFVIALPGWSVYPVFLSFQEVIKQSHCHQAELFIGENYTCWFLFFCRSWEWGECFGAQFGLVFGKSF